MRSVLIRLYFSECAIAGGAARLMKAVTPRPREILAVILTAVSIFAPVMPAAAQQAAVSAGIGQPVALEVDCSLPQYAGATWDATLANCVAATSTHDGTTWNMAKLRGTQTIAANPLQALVGFGGFAPVKSGVVKVGPGNYTLDQDLILTTGIRFDCTEPHEGGVSSTQGCNLIPAMPSLYNTGTVSTTAMNCPAGVNYCYSTWSAGTGSPAFQANQVGEFAMACTTTATGTLACPTGATGGAASNQGYIVSVNTGANTINVLTARSAEGNANTNVKYAIFPTFVGLGDGSVAFPAGCSGTGGSSCASQNGGAGVSIGSNFNIYFGGFTIDNSQNGVTGGYSFFNRYGSNGVGFDNINQFIPYDGGCGYIGSPGAQNSGPYGAEHSQWCLTGNGSFMTQHTAQGVIVRSIGAPPVAIANFAVALAGAMNGSNVTGIDTCALCIGSQVALGPGLKSVLGPSATSGSNVKNTTSLGIDINDNVTCYVACPDAEGDSSGGYLIGLTSTSGGAAAVKFGNATASLTGYNAWSINDDNTPASGIPYLLIDAANAVNVPYNDNASNSLAEYKIDSNGKSHTSAACSGCNTYILPTALGGTGLNLSGSTGVIQVASGTASAGALNLGGGSSYVTGTLPLVNMAQLFVPNAQSATYQVLAADFAGCKTIPVASGTFTITLVASGTQPAAGQCIWVENYGSGAVTIARSGQNLNGGTSTIALPASAASLPTTAYIFSDGTNYFMATMGLNASTLGGKTFAAPAPIGSGTAAGGSFTTATATTLNQTAAKSFAGSCSMSTATTCTFTLGSTFTAYLCFASIDPTSTVPATANSAKCAISGSTVTITAGISNSLTWDALLVGNPN